MHLHEQRRPDRLHKLVHKNFSQWVACLSLLIIMVSSFDWYGQNLIELILITFEAALILIEFLLVCAIYKLFIGFYLFHFDPLFLSRIYVMIYSFNYIDSTEATRPNFIDGIPDTRVSSILDLLLIIQFVKMNAKK